MRWRRIIFSFDFLMPVFRSSSTHFFQFIRRSDTNRSFLLLRKYSFITNDRCYQRASPPSVFILSPLRNCCRFPDFHPIFEPHRCLFYRDFLTRTRGVEHIEVDDHSYRAVKTALWCNFVVFSLKFGVWISTSSHVMLAELVHSAADFANQALLAYGLNSSKRAPDALHPYGYSKERFVWSLISAVGIFCLGSGATIVHGFQNLWSSQLPSLASCEY